MSSMPRNYDISQSQHQSHQPFARVDSIYAFFFRAAFALAAFFLLLLIITTLKKDPTTAEANRIRITGILIAQTRGGKTF